MARILAFLLLVTAVQNAMFQSAAGAEQIDRGFAKVAHEVPGFRLVLNMPPAPEERFAGGQGTLKTFADFKGKVVLVNLWATWCPPCIKEMPSLNALQERFDKDEFQILAIATGRQGRVTPREFLKKSRLASLDLFLDPHQSMLDAFETRTLPASFLLDRQGRVMGGLLGGADWDTDAAEAMVRYLLDKP